MEYIYQVVAMIKIEIDKGFLVSNSLYALNLGSHVVNL